MHDDDDGTAGAGREEASGSIRVAIAIFLVTLLMLMVLGIIWMFIRVEGPASGGQAARTGENPPVCRGLNGASALLTGKSLRDIV